MAGGCPLAYDMHGKNSLSQNTLSHPLDQSLTQSAAESLANFSKWPTFSIADILCLCQAINGTLLTDSKCSKRGQVDECRTRFGIFHGSFECLIQPLLSRSNFGFIIIFYCLPNTCFFQVLD